MVRGIFWGYIKMVCRTINLTLNTGMPRYRSTFGKLALGVSSGLAVGAGLALASGLGAGYYGGYGCFSPLGYSLATNPFGGMVANCLVTPYNFTSSLYADLDSPSGLRSVSPFVNSAINYPFSFSGLFGAGMIGGYIC